MNIWQLICSIILINSWSIPFKLMWLPLVKLKFDQQWDSINKKFLKDDFAEDNYGSIIPDRKLLDGHNLCSAYVCILWRIPAYKFTVFGIRF